MNCTSGELPDQTNFAALFEFAESETASWTDAELASVYRHQMNALLAVDLCIMLPPGAPGIAELCHACGGQLQTFADLAVHPRPSMDLLRLLKDFAKATRADGTLPKAVSTLLYCLAQSLAIIRLGQSTTRLDEQHLSKALHWAVSLVWIDAAARAVLEQALQSLEPEVGDAR